MVQFTREELLHIAELSSLHLDDSELSQLGDQLRQTLEYIEQLDEVVIEVEQEALRSINVFRDDKVIKSDSAKLLEQSPQSDDNYFVVPTILDK
jgi:aspartyl-tRNA(Asn)/glutamyl-tRNA(Gln) amidotransferase subunit C